MKIETGDINLHAQANEVQALSRRGFLRTSGGILLAATAAPLILTAPACDAESIEAIIKLAKVALKIAERVVGLIEARTSGSTPVQQSVSECLQWADSSGKPYGTPIWEHPKYDIVIPGTGNWGSWDLKGFDLKEEGEYVIVCESSSFYTVSDVIKTSTWA